MNRQESKQFIEDIAALNAEFKEGDVVLVRGTIKKLMYDTAFIETPSGTVVELKYKDHFMKELTRNGCLQD